MDNNNDLILRSSFVVTSADADMYGRLKLGALVNYLIQSAINSADSLGFGFKDLSQNNLFWVLSRLTIEINKPFQWYDTVYVETWPKTVDRLFYLRDYIVYNNQEQIMAKATSAWLAIDKVSKRPKIIEGTAGERFNQLKNRHAIAEPPVKLIVPVNSTPGIITPQYNDYDLNKHVTSTRYVDWMMDSFQTDFHKHNYPKQACINFTKETQPHQEIMLKRDESETLIFDFEGIHSGIETVAFRGQITF